VGLRRSKPAPDVQKKSCAHRPLPRSDTDGLHPDFFRAALLPSALSTRFFRPVTFLLFLVTISSFPTSGANKFLKNSILNIFFLIFQWFT
jgi:hypothetical protein